MKRILSIIIVLCLFPAVLLQAQPSGDHSVLKKVFNVAWTPATFDSYSFQILYLSNGKVYNLKNFCLADRVKNISQLAIQPGGASCALLTAPPARPAGLPEKAAKGLAKINSRLSRGSHQSGVEIYSANNSNECQFKISFPEAVQPTAICYAPDAKTFVVATSGGELMLYDTKAYASFRTLKSTLTPVKLAVSTNNYYLAAAGDANVEVWNLREGILRTQLAAAAVVNDIAFSEDNSMMAVAAGDGTVTVYETRSFTPVKTFTGMGQALSCRFYPNNKYMGIVRNTDTVVLQNLRNELDCFPVRSYGGGLSSIRYIEDLKNPEKIYLVYTSGKSLVLQQLADLKPNYSQQLESSVKTKMNEWMKMMDGESLEDYKIRVNDETRAQQQAIFEREVATQMAGELVEMADVSLGNYNTGKNVLALNFNSMPPIALEIGKEELSSMRPEALQFQNTVYGVNDKDEFEIIYTEVLNTETNKTYVYNNLDRMSVVAMDLDEGFVPLELIEQSNMEENKLKEIRENVVSEAKRSNLISDNTKINVSTEVIADVDANGKKIMNYKIGYQYEVAKEFTAKEDFPMGKYKTEASNAALSMLAIISKAFETDFAQYVKPGKQIKVKITGTADAAPITGRIAYDGCYGNFTNELVYKNGKLGNISVSKESGVTENEQLAFLRAAGVQDYIQKHIAALQEMKCDYTYDIKVSDQKGGAFRQIHVEFLFIDTFN